MSIQPPKPLIVSACLLGINCRFDGGNSLDSSLLEALSHFGEYILIPLCPEQLGGLPTPREPCEINSGSGEDVLSGEARVIGKETGRNFTANFTRGASETLKIARLFGCEKALFKSDSPSCGSGKIYRGGNLVEGNGVTTALLTKNGITVETL